MFNILGHFRVTSGCLVISDPCYTKDVWCRGELNKVVNGHWIGKVAYEKCSGRVSAILAVHENLAAIDPDNLVWQKVEFEVGVDSGQAGIFEEATYRKAEFAEQIPNPLCPDEPWYSMCCAKTLGPEQAGVVNGGVVSSSGYGDGIYDGFYAIDQAGMVVAVKIEFLPEYEEEEDSYAYEESEGEGD